MVSAIIANMINILNTRHQRYINAGLSEDIDLCLIYNKAKNELKMQFYLYDSDKSHMSTIATGVTLSEADYNAIFDAAADHLDTMQQGKCLFNDIEGGY